MYYRAEKLKKSLSQQDTDYDEFDSFNEQEDHVDESNYYEGYNEQNSNEGLTTQQILINKKND